MTTLKAFEIDIDQHPDAIAIELTLAVSAVFRTGFSGDRLAWEEAGSCREPLGRKIYNRDMTGPAVSGPEGSMLMGWVLRLAETGPDAAESIDLIEIHRSSGLADIANLGLTLSEAKELLARVQQAIVAAQARDHAVRRPSCASCAGQCHLKDWRPRRIATPFGEVAPRLRRWLCADCGRTETGIDWPEDCRSTPELNELTRICPLC